MPYKSFFTSILVLVNLILAGSCLAQDTITNGDIFDFTPGDKFQYKTSYETDTGILPSTYRAVTILTKSMHGDTVDYSEHLVKYSLSTDIAPLGYHISSDDTVLVTYVQLDSLLSGSDYLYSIDTSGLYMFPNSIYLDTTFVSAEMCNTVVNALIFDPEGFEDTIYQHAYGIGLGEITDYVRYGQGGQNSTTDKLIYYKKNEKECGVNYLPSSIGENEKSEIIIYPNPVNDYLSVDLNGNTQFSQAALINILGKKVQTHTITDPSFTMNLSDLPKGIYFLELSGKNLSSKRTIVKR